MRRSIVFAGVPLAVIATMMPAAVAAEQTLSIEHEPLRCMVAGRRAIISACFDPAAGIAEARIHYRRDAGTVWSQAAMRAEGACFAGVIPAFPRTLAGGRIRYFIEGTDRSAETRRTDAFAPAIVARALDCEGAGAAGPRHRISPALVAGGVAAAGVAGGLAIAGSGSVPSTTTTVPRQTPPVRESLPPTTPPPPVAGGPLALACQANPRTGTAPLRVDFAAFPTGATGSYLYEWSFGDGDSSNNPAPSHTYGAGRFEAVLRVTSGSEIATCTRDVTVTTAPSGPAPDPSPTPAPTPTPTPTPTPPPANHVLTLHMSGNIGYTVTSTPSGMTCTTPDNHPAPSSATCTASFAHGTTVVLHVGAYPFANWTSGCDLVQGPDCRVAMTSARTVTVFGVAGGRPAPEATNRWPEVGSRLDVDGGAGRVSVNGRTTVAAAGPESPATGVRRGANVVEGVLVAGRRPGTWRFAIGLPERLVPGSVRVVAGTVLVITPAAVVFRLEGKPGERVAFTFEVE